MSYLPSVIGSAVYSRGITSYNLCLKTKRITRSSAINAEYRSARWQFYGTMIFRSFLFPFLFFSFLSFTLSFFRDLSSDVCVSAKSSQFKCFYHWRVSWSCAINVKKTFFHKGRLSLEKNIFSREQKERIFFELFLTCKS